MIHGRHTDARIRRFGLMALVAAALTLPAWNTAQAQEDAPVNTGALTFSAGIDFATHYWFRGLAQENEGLIAQPWAEVGINVYSNDQPGAALTSADLSLGIWNSVHEARTGAAGATDVDPWYEADVYGGASFEWFGSFTTGVSYTFLTSPSDAFVTTEELGLSFGYDDSQHWADMGVEIPGFSGLQPSFSVIFETDGGADAGTELGTYFEIGISPSFTLIPSEDYPVTLGLPLTVGLGSDYYEDGMGNDDGFGYVDFGADVSLPLSFMPAEVGSWSAYAGVHVIVLGDAAETIAGPMGFGVTAGDSAEVYGTFGLSMEY